MTLQEELVAVCEKWRTRACKYRQEANEAELIRDSRSAERLAAMASTLEWAARDLSVHLGAPSRAPSDAAD